MAYISRRDSFGMPVGCPAARRDDSRSVGIPTLGRTSVMLHRHSDQPTPTRHAPDTPCTQRRTIRVASSAVPGSPPGNGVSATDGSRDGSGFPVSYTHLTLP